MKINVRKAITALVVVMISSLSLFAQQRNDVEQMLADEQKKEAIFSAILNDDELRKDLMQRMMNKAENDTSMCNMMGGKMMEDGHMMDMMMGNMMDKAEKDPAMCKKMCMMMMDSDKMMDMMDNMKNNEEPAEPGNKQGKTNMHKHMEDMHQRKNKK